MKDNHKYPESTSNYNISEALSEENLNISEQEIIKNDSILEDTKIIVPDISENDLAYHNKKFGCLPYAHYKYTDGFFIVRWHITKDNQLKKEFVPYIYDVQKKKWVSKFPLVRSLYNLSELALRPDSPVLIVEGEKTADAAKQLFPDFVVVTSSGGAKSANKSDWSVLQGRDIVIAPDNDEVGISYTKKIQELCSSIVSNVRFLYPKTLGKYTIENSSIIERQGEVPQGYDLADSLADGWTAELISQAMNDERFVLFFVEDCIKTSIANDNITTEELLTELAKLSDIEYGQQRKEAAKKLGVAIAFLDRAIKAKHCENQNNADFFESITPFSNPVELKKLLEELEEVFKRYAVLPEHVTTALALWCVFTYLIDVMDIAPILIISSPEKRCGKTTLLSILLKLVYKPLSASNISSAALFRIIDAWKPTLIIDEADTFIKASEELKGVINSGHTRPTAFVIRNVGDDHNPKQFSTWGAKVIAVIGDVPDTINDRSIVISLKRKLNHEIIEKIRNADPLIFDNLRSKLLRFANDNAGIIKNIRPSFPADINISDRALDNWEPLLAIAGLAGEDWINKVYQAAQALSPNETDITSVGVELLQDIQKIFIEKNITEISTKELIEALCEDEESRWVTYNFKGNDKSITARQISRILKEYKIKSKNVRFGEEVLKAYEKIQFEDAWKRYNNYISSNSTTKLSATTLQKPAKPVIERDVGVADNLNVSVTELASIKESATTCLGENHFVADNFSLKNIVEDKENLSATPESLIYKWIEEKCSVVADNLEGINENNNIIYVFLERQNLLQYLKELDKSVTYGIDIETTGLNPSNSTVALLQIYNPTIDKVFVYKLYDAPLTNEEKQILSEIRFVAHNASFERSFMPYLKNLDCSMIAYHAATSNSRCRLSDISSEVGITYNNKKYMQTSDWSGELTEEQLEYAAKDAKATYLLWEKYKDKNKPVYDRMYKASFIIDGYSKRGLPVDIEALSQLRIDTESKRDKDLQKLIDLGFEDIITPAQNITTKQETLNNLSRQAQEIVDQVRKYNSLLNNIIIGVEDNIINDRLPINAKICGTETGRLATVNPNVQNFPRSGFRHIFKASKEHMFIKADFAAQELRMAAALSGEKVMLEAFNNGIDLHALMAAKLNNISIDTFKAKNEAWKKAERQKAKASNFGFLYGMGAKKFVILAKNNYGIELTEKEAEIIKNKFWQTYPILKRWCDEERIRCNKRGYALTKGGRKRFFADVSKGYCEKINTAVQGSCGEVLLETLLALPDDLKGYLVNTVHDELVFEVPTKVIEDEAKYNALKQAIIKAMKDGVLKIEPRYPLRDIAEIKEAKTLE
jgi:putative DNA primase/helicase